MKKNKLWMLAAILTLPVMNINEIPFGYVIEGNRLKLHYYGNYTCDHVPATFVFKRK